MKIPLQIHLITMGKANGKRNKYYKNGIKLTQIGILILSVQP